VARLLHVAAFLRQQRAQGRADATLRNHHRALTRLDSHLQTLNGTTSETVTPFQLADFVCALQLAPDHRNQHTSALRVYFRWLCETGLREDNPAAHLRYCAAPAKPVESLTPEEVRALLTFARKPHPRFGTARTSCLVLFLVETGLRLGEALSLRLPDLDLIENQVHVTATKTNSLRLLPISADLRQCLLAYLRERRAHFASHHLPDAGWLWPAEHGAEWTVTQAERGCKTVARNAGLTRRFHPHLLRHTFATLSLLNGAPLSAVMQLGGWKKLATVQRYTRMSTEQLRQVAADSSPLAGASRLRYVIPED